jgi:hypothetical protein
LRISKLQDDFIESIEKEALIARQEGRWVPPTQDFIIDPETLIRSFPNLEKSELQSEIVEAYMTRIFYQQMFYAFAAIIFLLGATPICWYFLLARLRELSSAIRGI